MFASARPQLTVICDEHERVLNGEQGGLCSQARENELEPRKWAEVDFNKELDEVDHLKVQV